MTRKGNTVLPKCNENTYTGPHRGKHQILTKCDEDANSRHMIKTNNEDFSLKFPFLRAANNYMHVGYDQANKLVGVLVLCLGSKAVVFVQYLHKYHQVLILSGSEFFRARVCLYGF